MFLSNKFLERLKILNGSWERAVNAVRIAKQYCKVSQINFVLQQDNCHEVMAFSKLARELEVPAVIIPCSLKLAAQPPISDDLTKFNKQGLKDSINIALEAGGIANQEFLKSFLSKLEKGGGGRGSGV